MSGAPQIPLVPLEITANSAIFKQLDGFPYSESFVSRILRNDVRIRATFGGKLRIWVYLDPDGQIVGFGTLDVSNEYSKFAGGGPHPFIPLLAVRADMERKGYGTRIVWHLIGQATVLTYSAGNMCEDIVFLEVYETSLGAISLYEKCGFQKLRDTARFDDQEKQNYFAMARRVSVSVP